MRRVCKTGKGRHSTDDGFDARVERAVEPASFGVVVSGVDLAGVDEPYETRAYSVNRTPVTEGFRARADDGENVPFVRVGSERVRHVMRVEVLDPATELEPRPLAARSSLFA